MKNSSPVGVPTDAQAVQQAAELGAAGRPFPPELVEHLRGIAAALRQLDAISRYADSLTKIPRL